MVICHGRAFFAPTKGHPYGPGQTNARETGEPERYGSMDNPGPASPSATVIREGDDRRPGEGTHISGPSATLVSWLFDSRA